MNSSAGWAILLCCPGLGCAASHDSQSTGSIHINLLHGRLGSLDPKLSFYDYRCHTETPDNYPTEGPPPTIEFTITASDFYDNDSISNFSIIISNSSNTFLFNSTNGTVTIGEGIINATDKFYNFTIITDDYFNNTVSDFNFTQPGSLKMFPHQSEVLLNATDLTDMTQIISFNASVPLQILTSNSSGEVLFKLRAGNYTVIGSEGSHINTTLQLIVSPVSRIKGTLNFGANHLHVNATSFVNRGNITIFTSTLEDLNSDFMANLSTTTGEVVYSLDIGNFSVTLSADGFVTQTQNITVDSDHVNFTFLMFEENSILINIFREGTTTPLNDTTVTADFDSDIFVDTFTTDNGTIFQENLLPAAYTITFSASGFTTRDYFITLASGSNVLLNAFLINATDTADITFTIRDASNQKLTQDVLITVSDKINLSFVVIAQKTTDISGSAIFELDQTKQYRFSLSKLGFQTRTFDLTPSLTAYTIELIPTTLIDYETIFASVDFTTLPTSNILLDSEVDFSNLQDFSIISVSLNGAVIEYFGVNTSISGTPFLNNVSGSPGGGTATISLNLSTFNLNTLSVTYFIKVDGRPIQIIPRDFFISNFVGGNTSLNAVLPDLAEQIGSPAKEVIGTLIVILVLASLAAIGISGKNLSLAAGGVVGVVTLFGFFDLTIGGIITVIMFLVYFLSGDKLG